MSKQGYMIHQAGVGVRPVPVTQLSSDKLAEAFLELKSPRLAQAAQDMAKAFASEDGAKEGPYNQIIRAAQTGRTDVGQPAIQQIPLHLGRL
jgi:hypothetical protein